MTNFSSWETIGPLELVYSTAEGILDAVQGATHMHTISDFIHMVQWREPFILTLLALQFLIFTLAYTTRNSEFAHIVVLLLIVSITFAAEHLNDYGRTHWMSFASQNYFDTSGVFMLVFVTAPFVVLVNFIVVSISFIAHLHAITLTSFN